MTSSTVVVAITLAYLVASLVIGLLPAGKASSSATGYVAGDRSMGLLVMYFITGATIFSAFAFLGGPGWSYSRGAASYYILGYGTLGFLPFYFLGPRAARLGRRFQFVTQAEMVAARYEMPSLAITMAAISTAAFIPYLALQIKGAGYVLNTVTRGGISQELGSAVVYGVVLLYVLKSGVLGVGWTNTFQGLLMMALAWTLGLYLPRRLYGGIGPMFAQIARARPELLRSPGLASTGQSWGWGPYSSAVIVSTVGFSVWPHTFMKAFSARSERTIRRTVVLYPTFQLFLIPLFLIGYCGVLFATQPPRADQVLPFILMSLDMPSLVVGIFCSGALAASMSSGDAIAHAAASIVVRDGYLSLSKRTLSPIAERRLIRYVVIAVMATSYAVAVLYRGSLVTLLLSTYGAVVQFAPALVATLYLRRVSGRALLSGLLLGGALTGAFVISPDLRPWDLHPGLYGLTANTLTLVIGSLGHRPSQHAQNYLATAATPPAED